MRRAAHYLNLACVLAALAGCTSVTPPLLDNRTAGFATPASISGLVTPCAWWTKLADPVLDKLVDDAVEHNFTVQAAVVRLAQAQGADRNTVWTLVPSGSLSKQESNTRLRDYSQEGLSTGSPPTNAQSTGTSAFAVSWEVPLFGKGGAIVAQGTAQARQAHWSLEGARLAVAAEVVRSYAEYRGTEVAAQALRQSVSMLEELVGHEETVRVHGLSTMAEVNQLKARLLDQRMQLLSSSTRAEQLIAKLDSLLGQASGTEAVRKAPSAPSLQSIAATSALADFALPVAIEIRADALRLRPDIRAAEEGVALAAARAGIAAANLWPQLSLGGNLTLTAGNLDSLGATRGATNIVTTTAGLKIPLLDWFALKAEANAKQLELDAVTLEYRQTVVAGWEETRSGLADYAGALDRTALSRQAVQIAQEEVGRQRAFRVAGIGTRQAELSAQLTANEKAIALAADRFGALQSWAKLMKASFASADLPKPMTGATSAIRSRD